MLGRGRVASEAQWGVIQLFFRPSKFVGSDKFVPGISERSAATGLKRRSLLETYSGVPTSLVYEAFESDRSDYWKAEISIGRGLGVTDMVVVLVTGWEDRKIDAAELVLLGSSLKVSKGIAFYRLEDFQRNLANTEVELVLAGKHIPGTLKLGDETLV